MRSDMATRRPFFQHEPPCADRSFTRSSFDQVEMTAALAGNCRHLFVSPAFWKMLRLIRGNEQGEEIMETR